MKDADFPLSASLHGNVCSSPLIKQNSGGVGERLSRFGANEGKHEDKTKKSSL